MLGSTNGFAATKVTTTKIIVPEEAPSEVEQETENSVPLDELGPDPTVVDSETADEKEQNQPLPQVLRDYSKLPSAVREMRQKLIDAATTGNSENLRPLMCKEENATALSFGGETNDPIQHLKEESGDEDGQEILAILIEILEAGFVHLDEGTADEVFAWPYFFAYPLDKLTPPMRVELFRILTAGDLEDSAAFGSYIFYRTGIKPDGTWSFFIAGD